MKKQELELEKKFISLNGYQMGAVRGGGVPDDNGEGGGEGNPGSGPDPGGTDNLCGSCPYHRNG